MTNFGTVFAAGIRYSVVVREGKYSIFVAILILAPIVSALVGLWMLGSLPSTFQTPVTITNLLKRTTATPATSAVPAPTPPAPATATVPGRGRAKPAPASAGVGQSQGDVNVASSPDIEARADVETRPTARGPASAPAAADPAKHAPETPASAEIYSASDADVTPPKANHPQWFGFQRFDIPTREIVTFEVIIDEQGHVDSTRVMNAAGSLAETMLYTMALQAIRSWNFEPALKAGTPVKFRFVISFFGSGNEVAPIESR